MTGDILRNQTSIDQQLEDLSLTVQETTLEVVPSRFSQADDEGNKNQKLERSYPIHPVDVGNSSERHGNSSKSLAEDQDRASLDWLFAIANQMHSSETINALLTTIVTEVRQYLQADRVLIYRFQGENQGVVVAESMVRGYTPSLNVSLPAIAFGAQKPEDYQQQPFITVDRLANPSLTPYQFQLLEQFQVLSCLSLPIWVEEPLWGLLVIQQCSNPHKWEDIVVNRLEQVVRELRLSLQSLNFRNERQALLRVSDQIRSSLDIETIFQTTTREVQKLLDVERVVICKFRPDYCGDFVVESKVSNLPQMVGRTWEDTYIKEDLSERFRDHQPYVVENVHSAGLIGSHLQLLENFEIQAYAIAPIFVAQELWGLLCVYQHSNPRHWVETEIKLLLQFTNQLEIALQQAQLLEEKAKGIALQLGTTLQEREYVSQLEAQATQMSHTAQVDHAVALAIPKILQSQDLDTVFRVTSLAVRQLLRCDRVAICRYNPDGSNDLVADWSTKGLDRWQQFYMGVIFPKTDRSCVHESLSRHRESIVVNNIHTSSHSPDEIEILEEIGVKTYVLTPIFKDDLLWGLLGVYHSSETRSWTEMEISALKQICVQMGVAIRQIDYIEELQAKSAQLAKTTERERLIGKIVDRIHSSLDLLHTFNITAREIRNFMEVDRVAIFKLDSELGYSNGTTIAENVRPGYVSSLEVRVTDHCFTQGFAEHYQNGRICATDDIYQAGLANCYIQLLAQFQVRANLVVSLLKGNELWGLLCIHQCSGPREWQAEDIEFVKQIAAQLNVAIQQGEYINQLQQQSQQLAEAVHQQKSAKEQLQQEVMQLLLAVRPALEGNLTVRAQVTDTEVGTIADAYNNTLSSLRQIVTQMLIAANQVTQTSQANGSAITRLAAQAQEQGWAQEQALEKIQTMVASTEAVKMNAALVEAAVQQANQTVIAGDEAIDRAVDEMEDIREIVVETNQRLQRLSESSRKISRVVSLITSFTEQTQLLALNASIEATRAGEFGRGFGVIADEVHLLARRSANAAIEIEELVEEIQASTSEVSMAMDIGIQQVESGTTVVNEARQNLNDIVNATAQISQLVTGITQASQQQTQQCQLVTQTMTKVAVIANKTSKDAVRISASFKELLTMAQDLQSKSKKFKIT